MHRRVGGLWALAWLACSTLLVSQAEATSCASYRAPEWLSADMLPPGRDWRDPCVDLEGRVLLGPRNAVLSKARAHAAEGRYEEARVDYANFARLFPEHDDAFASAAHAELLALSVGDRPDLAAITRLSAVPREVAEALLVMARHGLALQRHRETSRLAAAAERLAGPQDWDLIVRARVLQAVAQIADAKRSEADRKDSGLRRTLGRRGNPRRGLALLRWATGRWRSAEGALRWAVEMTPDEHGKGHECRMTRLVGAIAEAETNLGDLQRSSFEQRMDRRLASPQLHQGWHASGMGVNELVAAQTHYERVARLPYRWVPPQHLAIASHRVAEMWVRMHGAEADLWKGTSSHQGFWCPPLSRVPLQRALLACSALGRRSPRREEQVQWCEAQLRKWHFAAPIRRQRGLRGGELLPRVKMPEPGRPIPPGPM